MASSRFEKPNAGRQPLPEAGATQEQRLEAVGCTPGVRRRFWHRIPPALDTPSFLPPLALTAPCMRRLAPQIMQLSAPPALPSPLSHRWAASADEPIGLVQHHRVNGESQRFGGLHIDDELDVCVRLHRELRWLRPVENLVHQARRLQA